MWINLLFSILIGEQMNDPEFRTKQEMGKKKRYDSEELQDAAQDRCEDA